MIKESTKFYSGSKILWQGNLASGSAFNTQFTSGEGVDQEAGREAHGWNGAWREP